MTATRYPQLGRTDGLIRDAPLQLLSLSAGSKFDGALTTSVKDSSVWLRHWSLETVFGQPSWQLLLPLGELPVAISPGNDMIHRSGSSRAPTGFLVTTTPSWIQTAQLPIRLAVITSVNKRSPTTAIWSAAVTLEFFAFRKYSRICEPQPGFLVAW